MKEKLQKIAREYNVDDFEVYKVNGFYQSRLCARALKRGEDLKEYLKDERVIMEAYRLTLRYFKVFGSKEE